MTTTTSLTGAVTLIAWSSKEELLLLFSGASLVNFQCLEMRTPVPPPHPTGRGVCEKVESTESAASVAVFSGRIQVSVRASICLSD